jgi:hypothetical protein
MLKRIPRVRGSSWAQRTLHLFSHLSNRGRQMGRYPTRGGGWQGRRFYSPVHRKRDSESQPDGCGPESRKRTSGEALLHELLKRGNSVPCNASIISADQPVWARCAGQCSPVSGDRSSALEDDWPDTRCGMRWARPGCPDAKNVFEGAGTWTPIRAGCMRAFRGVLQEYRMCEAVVL